MKLTVRQMLKVSALAAKLELNVDVTKDTEDVGADLIMQVMKKIHTAEDEVAELVGVLCGVSKEDALDVDLFEKLEEFKKSDLGKNLQALFSARLKSGGQG